MSKILMQFQFANILTAMINHRKIIIIEQLRNIRTTPTETLKERLKQRENFWLMKLETLEPLGLNQDQFELVLSIVKTKIILLWR